MSDTKIVPGMAWLPGTGPAGTFCVQCAQAVSGVQGKMRCRKSLPVKGRLISFADWMESCRHFEERRSRR